jgi:hypothetical protein
MAEKASDPIFPVRVDISEIRQFIKAQRNNRPVDLYDSQDCVLAHYCKSRKIVFTNKKLFEYIERAIEDLKHNPFSGIKIQKDIWPKEYIEKYDDTDFIPINR